jgi:hypothetical protein
MKWAVPFRVDPRSVIDKYKLYNRILNRNRAKMRGAGSPCTLYRNSAITLYGTAPENLTKCYCWSKSGDDDTATEINSQPKRDHFLCMGTGYLQGYDKYGYGSIIASTPSNLTFSTSNISVAQDASGEPDRIIISGSSQNENLETENYTLTNFQEVDHFLAKDATDTDTNRIKYYYSTDDGGTWTEITMVDYTDTALGNKQSSGFTLPIGTTQIKFKIELEKRYATSPSPRFNSIRFRYRNHVTLYNMDPRFTIQIPSFLASREQVALEVKQGEYGWKTTRPMRWWVLPETNVQEGDIIMFLQGEFEDQKYEIQNLTEHTHGPSLQVLHRDFESAFLRDNRDIIRIVDLLI